VLSPSDLRLGGIVQKSSMSDCGSLNLDSGDPGANPGTPIPFSFFEIDKKSFIKSIDCFGLCWELLFNKEIMVWQGESGQISRLALP
jgi:hypothetical protein